MIDISLEHDFDFAGSEYFELFAEASATAFQHPVWLKQLFGSLALQAGGEPLPIAIRENPSGRLIAVIPLMRIRRRGIKIVEFADLGVTDYCAPIVRNGYNGQIRSVPQVADKILELLGQCDIIRAKSVRPEHAALVEQMTGSEPHPAGFSAHEAPLEQPYAEWRAKAFSKSKMKYIDRKRRRFERLGNTALQLVQEPKAARAAITELKVLRAGRFDGDPIQQASVENFYAEIAERGCENGFARTYRLSENGRTVGIVFGITHLGRFNYLLIGCDYDNYSKHSPGLLMYDQIMADWVSAGGDIFDFTIGDEPFKADFGTRPIQMSGFNRAISITGRVADSIRTMSKRIA